MTEPAAPTDQAPVGEPPAAPAEQPTVEHLPDDHPLVKAYNATKEQLADAKRTAKANADAAAKLAEIEAANLTQAEKDAAALQEARDKAASLERDLLRLKVASAKGIPAELADRLIGSDIDEMNEDADRLLAVMKPTTPPAPTGTADQGPQGPAATGQLTKADLSRMTPDEIVAAKAAGRLNALLGIT